MLGVAYGTVATTYWMKRDDTRECADTLWEMWMSRYIMPANRMGRGGYIDAYSTART